MTTLSLLIGVLLLPLVTANPDAAFAQSRHSSIGEKIYDTEDGKFRVHYKNVSEEYAEFVGHAFSKAREFQLALGFNDVLLTRTTHDSEVGRVAIYVKDLIYDDRASETVIGQTQLQYFLVSDNLEKWQIYLAAAHCYFMAVQASYNTLGYEASEGNAWVNDGIARFITLYTAMNDPEYKEYDPEYKQYGYLDNVMVEGKKTYGYAPYQVPTITSDAPLQNGLTKLGSLSVSYWYYLHKLYGMKIIEDVMVKTGSVNDDSIRTVSSVLTNYNATFVQSVAGWYESLGFWNKGKSEYLSKYEGLTLVNDEMFTGYKSSKLPIKIKNELSRYGASFISLNFDSNSPVMKIRFLNSGETVYVYAYIHDIKSDKYYHKIFEVERGHQDLPVWTGNTKVDLLVIGGEKTFRGGLTIERVR